MILDEENGTINTPLVVSSPKDELRAASYQKQGFSFTSEESSAPTENAGSSLHGRLLLVLVALLYGSLNVSLRLVYELPGSPSASALSTARGWLATACFIPFLARQKPNDTQSIVTSTDSLWKVATQLALLNFGAQGFFNLGLLTTESARAAFLAQTSVVMTPILSAVYGQRPHYQIWIGCTLALIGLLLLSNNGNGAVLSFGAGDIFCLAGALCWSGYIFRLSAIGNSFNEVMLQGAKTFVLALCYTMWFVFASLRSEVGLWLGWASATAWALLFYSALGPGTIADIVQQKGQTYVSASEANVILSMEPIFTAILGFLLLGEATSWQEKIGGGLIVVASIISSN